MTTASGQRTERTAARARLALIGAVALVGACAGCRTPGVRPTARTAPATSGTPDTVSALRDSREAMARLSSFEAHRTATERDWGGDLKVTSVDIRFELPDRHSWASRGWMVGPAGPWKPVRDADAGEARQIGSSYWWRRSALDAAAQWSCSLDETRPDPMSYSPPLDAVYVGAEETSLGTSWRFRSEAGGTTSDWWIDPGSRRVTRIETTRGDDSAFEIVTYRLGEFDTPSRIAAPGPCAMATATLGTDD